MVKTELIAGNFEELMNDIVAPVTRAWTDYTIEEVHFRGTDIEENEATFTVRVKAKRKTAEPN